MESTPTTSSEVGESSSIPRLSSGNSNSCDKAVFVRVKRKLDQSPLEAFWLQINERPAKRPLIDFQKLSISDSSAQIEELKVKRVLVEHVETVWTSEASIRFLQSFVPPTSDGDSKLKASSKDRRRALLKENIHDKLLSKAKQEQEEIAKTARFEQIWKRRKGKKEAVHDEDLDGICRVYDVLRIDKDKTSRMKKKQEEISVDDQYLLSKFLPLLKECVPDAAEEIESDISAHASRLDSADEFVYDLYAIKEKSDGTEASYPFPLVQVDDDDHHYDGPDDSDYETEDSNAEDHPNNDYPDEESSDEDEERTSNSGSESEEEESEEECEMWAKSEDSMGYDRSEDHLYEEEMDGDEGEDSRWAHHY